MTTDYIKNDIKNDCITTAQKTMSASQQYQKWWLHYKSTKNDVYINRSIKNDSTRIVDFEMTVVLKMNTSAQQYDIFPSKITFPWVENFATT